MIDKQGRLFGRINILDLLVLLVVVLAVGKFVYDQLEVDQIVGPQTEPISVQMQGDVLNEIAGMINVGDQIYDKLTGIYLGTVTEVSSVPVPVGVGDGSGGAIWAGSPRSSQVTLTVAANGVVTEKDYQIGALSIRVGESRVIYGPKYALYINPIRLAKGH